MTFNRRRFLAGTAIATIASAGCLQADDGSGTGNGNGNGSGNGDDDSEPTTAVPEEPRVDDPPYDIEEQPSDPEEWNQLYLCENMSGDSDLEFQTVPAPRADLLLRTVETKDEAYAVRALTSAAEVREVFELGDGGSDEGPEEPIDEIDFEENVLLVVESGFGSGSVTHHWKRAEATDRGVHLHGCQTTPLKQTHDFVARHSVVRVERPETFELARVSLTVGAERRVHFNSSEGVVTVDAE
ncbi:hypothetical protein [Natrinema altunense]|uniref:Uncharacterized protein n=1 Tax=Natrinema altunense (strain JCM 12890 / CGMCC 1.3731 / AJ2) TaxID=1227494 RepID=L9ZIP5_NATA2|nr:hypothetical protein [Natrinema altunense]ELY85921.1 hypothetical protein C485_11988 [Natrinema altunense JCM 12890]